MACKTSGGLKRHIESAHNLPQRLRASQATAQSPQPLQVEDDLPAMDVDPPSPSMEWQDAEQERASPPSNTSDSDPEHPPPPPSLPSQPRANPKLVISHHPILDGTPCDSCGNDLPPDSPPPPPDERAKDDFTPFEHRPEFEFAEFLFSKAQMSGGNTTTLMQLLAALYPDNSPPYADADDLYSTIDSISQGSIPWQNFSVVSNGEVDNNAPPWKTAHYEVWFRDPLLVMEQQIGNADFNGDVDYAPKQVVDDQGRRQYSDLMSGNWAWQQAVRIDLFWG